MDSRTLGIVGERGLVVEVPKNVRLLHGIWKHLKETHVELHVVPEPVAIRSDDVGNATWSEDAMDLAEARTDRVDMLEDALEHDHILRLALVREAFRASRQNGTLVPQIRARGLENLGNRIHAENGVAHLAQHFHHVRLRAAAYDEHFSRIVHADQPIETSDDRLDSRSFLWSGSD
jgi:hypothetical protein